MENKVLQPEISRVFLEIFVHGKPENKEKLQKVMEIIQNQMFTKKYMRQTRICYLINDASEQEQKDYLAEQSKCKYHVYFPVDTFTVDKDYVKTVMTRLKKMELYMGLVRESGVVLSKEYRDKVKEKATPVEPKVSNLKILK